MKNDLDGPSSAGAPFFITFPKRPPRQNVAAQATDPYALTSEQGAQSPMRDDVPAQTKDAYAFTPRGFEFEVARKLEIEGFHVTVTPASRDFGADIIANRGGEVYLVEVKLYRSPVGPGVIQRALGAMLYQGASRVIVVNPGGFTAGAHEVAARGPVELRTS